MPGGTNDPAPTVTRGELVSPTVAAEPDGAHDADASRLPVVGREHYAVEGEFARGGMGRILSARDRRLGRTVALKELQATASPNARRFVREALVTARLQHPAIVPIYEAGRWPDGVPFYAMKLVTGRSLDALIRAAEGGLAGRLALLPHLLAVAEAVAEAVAYAGPVRRGGDAAVALAGAARQLDGRGSRTGARGAAEAGRPLRGLEQALDGRPLPRQGGGRNALRVEPTPRATTPVAQRKRSATSIRTAGTLVAVKVPPEGTTVLAR